MSHDQTAAPRAFEPSGRSSPAAQPPDERDAAIARLERALAEERQQSAALRTSVDGLKFQIDVLEKSYAKQLADARQRTDAAQKSLLERAAELTALAENHEEAKRQLAEARRDLERSSPVRSRATDARGRASAPSASPASGTFEPAADGGTINTLLGAAPWREEQPTARVRSPDKPSSRAGAEPPAEEMLAPELVFTGDEDADAHEK